MTTLPTDLFIDERQFYSGAVNLFAGAGWGGGGKA